MEIIKAAGGKQKFSKDKLYRSLKRAGVQSGLAKKVSERVGKNVYSGMGSGKILDQAVSYLRKESPALAARYNLKKAIMTLGPTGFPFERYIAEILKEYGYRVRVGKVVWGRCISHEIDVTAQKGKNRFMIECKYHNSRGNRSDSKVAMYTLARFLDLKDRFQQAWLVTNTKCTSQAIRYAKCAGLKIIGWRYPKGESLEYLIENKGLYPITVLPSLNRYAKERFAQKKIMMAKDLLRLPVSFLVSRVGIKAGLAARLKKEAEQLCP